MLLLYLFDRRDNYCIISRSLIPESLSSSSGHITAVTVEAMKLVAISLKRDNDISTVKFRPAFALTIVRYSLIHLLLRYHIDFGKSIVVKQRFIRTLDE